MLSENESRDVLLVVDADKMFLLLSRGGAIWGIARFIVISGVWEFDHITIEHSVCYECSIVL